MTTNHNQYLNLAFNQAEINLGKTKLNPSVGSIIVKQGSVISSGITSISGRPHSEFNALNNNINYKNSNLYVTLEPCTHFGLTPPCVNIIVNKKIKNVYFSFHDPDKRTYKKAKKILNKNKIYTKKIISKKFENFYESYFQNKKKKLPFVSAKIAISKDFYTINKKTKWITNIHSRKVTHLIRSKFDCVISTSKSINKDNSLLNCRINGMDNYKPDLIIIDLNLNLKKNLLLKNLNKRRKTYIITTSKNEKKILFFRKQNYKIIKIKSLQNLHDFDIFFKKIYQLGYGRVLFETGLTFLSELIKKKLLNNLYLFQSNKKIKRSGINNISSKYLKKIKLNNVVKVNLNNDKLYKIRFNKYV